jgi:hypothetical protein
VTNIRWLIECRFDTIKNPFKFFHTLAILELTSVTCAWITFFTSSKFLKNKTSVVRL